MASSIGVRDDHDFALSAAASAQSACASPLSWL
jgi:hypothetical protein